jgi:hypothetical protein
VLRGGTAAGWLETVLARAQGDVVMVSVADYDEAERRLVEGDVGAWAVLSQHIKSDPRLASMTPIPRPIVGEPLAIAMQSDPDLHRAGSQRSAGFCVAGVRGVGGALVW